MVFWSFSCIPPPPLAPKRFPNVQLIDQRFYKQFACVPGSWCSRHLGTCGQVYSTVCAPGKRCSCHLGKCGQVYSAHQESGAPAILEHADRFTVRTRKTVLPPSWKMRTGLQCTPGKWCSRQHALESRLAILESGLSAAVTCSTLLNFHSC